MKTSVRFRANKFPPYDGEEEQINPGRWGKRLAEYLVQNLADLNIATEAIIPEDWGWLIPVRNDSFPLYVACGHQDGDDDEFLCFVDPSRPVIRRWFKKIDTREHIERVTDALDKVLASDPEIRDICWMMDSER